MSASWQAFVRKSRMNQYFFQEAHIQCRLVAFGANALFAWMPLQQPQGQAAQQGEILPSVPLLNPAGIFTKGYIELPV
jgi:hypothetical protein